MYRGIIEKKGRKWDDCKVLSFAFKCHFSREKSFARLDDAVAFMESLGYVNAN